MKNHIPTYDQFVNENKINEGSSDPSVKKEAISRLSDFFRVSGNALTKFNFDGKDNIKELTKALNSTSDQGTELYYKTAIKLSKEELGIHESTEVNEGVSTAGELASFISQNAKHFASFLKPKTLSAIANGNIVEIKPGSKSFTITVDFDKKTIDTTGKPAWPESVSYIEIMEYVKITKFKIHESVVNEGAVKAFEMDYTDLVKNIKSGYGWIDPEFVSDTWENIAASIDFEIVKDEIYNRLIKAGLLYYADPKDPEAKGKKVTNLSQI